MEELDRKRIADLIKTDLLVVGGGKGAKSTAVWAFAMTGIIFLLGGFIISPMAGCLVPMILAAMIVGEIAGSEKKSHCENMYAVLPVTRRELVRSRFVFVTALTAALCGIMYLLMLLSMKLKLYVIISGGADIIGIMSEKTDGALSELGALNICFSLGTYIGLTTAAGCLRSYFIDSGSFGDPDDPMGEVFGSKTKKYSVRDKILITFCLAFSVCGILALSGVIQIFAPLAIIAGLFMKLAQAADGLLLAAVFLTMGAFSVAYTYICAVIDYEDKDI